MYEHKCSVFYGVSSTFRIYGFGKAALMKKIKSNNTLQQAANVFEEAQSSAAEIENTYSTMEIQRNL